MKSAFARLFALATVIALIFSTSISSRRPPSTVAAQTVEEAGTLTELSIDDGVARCALGAGSPVVAGFGWVNKLTPPSYPATLRSITIGFNRAGQLVEPDLSFRIVVFIDGESDGPSNGQQPFASFAGRVRGGDTFMTYNLVSPIKIASGSFVIGAIDLAGVAEFPALFDAAGKSNPTGSESYFTLDAGILWRTVRDGIAPGVCDPGSFLIRAVIESDPADVMEIKNTIRDPLAAEPWSVAVNNTATEAIVANFASDNVTIIKTSDNSFRNLAVGDGPEGTPDGPFGVAIRPDGARAYVTLFGSNTVPTREAPIDFSTVGPGRVSVLVKQTDGSFAQSALISVGKGPGFPAILADGSKLYVPCGGINTVDVISTATNERLRSIPVGVAPSSCALSIDGGKLYVTNFGESSITVINTRTDQVIKTIANLSASEIAPQTHPERLPAPWRAALSPLNGNLYVTMRDPNAVVHPPLPAAASDHIIEIDTCRDEFARAITDDAARGTPAGSTDGGGGPFGICAFTSGPTLVFTNDGLGTISAIDSRTDQVISSPHLSAAMVPTLVPYAANTRDVACSRVGGKATVYVAVGAPDNSVEIVTLPDLGENIATVPVITSVRIAGAMKIGGSGMKFVDHVEVIAQGSADCLTFKKRARFKKDGRLVLQKGNLVDGRSISEAVPVGSTAFVRVVNLDKSVRLFRFTRDR
ncbi:MAG: YncE family protein [Acidobacteriota bacterium]